MSAHPNYPRATSARGAQAWICKGCDAGPWDTLAELDEHNLAVGLRWGGLPAPTSGPLGLVPLAPTRARPLTGVAAIFAALAVVGGSVLMALGIVHLVHLLGGGR